MLGKSNAHAADVQYFCVQIEFICGAPDFLLRCLPCYGCLVSLRALFFWLGRQRLRRLSLQGNRGPE